METCSATVRRIPLVRWGFSMRRAENMISTASAIRRNLEPPEILKDSSGRGIQRLLRSFKFLWRRWAELPRRRVEAERISTTISTKKRRFSIVGCKGSRNSSSRNYRPTIWDALTSMRSSQLRLRAFCSISPGGQRASSLGKMLIFNGRFVSASFHISWSWKSSDGEFGS